MSDELRNTLRAVTSGEPSPGDAWSRFRSQRRRSNIVRMGVAVTAGLAAFVALVLILPGVNAGRGDSPINIGESLEPRPPVASKHYKDAEGRFQLDFPAAWFGRGFANESADFYPKVGDLNEGSSLMDFDGGGARPVRAKAKSFFIRIHIRHPGEVSELSDPADLARRREAGAAIKRGGIFPSHASQPRSEQLRVTYPAAPLEPVGGWTDGEPRYWCAGCIVEELAIVRPKDVIEILIVSPGQDAYNAYRELALAIIDSIEDYIAPTPGASPDRI